MKKLKTAKPGTIDCNKSFTETASFLYEKYGNSEAGADRLKNFMAICDQCPELGSKNNVGHPLNCLQRHVKSTEKVMVIR